MQTKLISMEDAVGKVVFCPRAGYERLVTKVDKDYVTYSLKIAEGVWQDLGPTYRAQVEDDFLNGYVVMDAQNG